jgi:hypothetical protein
MNRLLIPSGRFVIRSDERSGSFRTRPAQTPSPARARLAADRTRPARHIGRDLQALWAAELPLRQRTGAWPEAISVDQPTRRAASKGLRAQRHPCAGRPIDRQLPQAARYARRDLHDQRGTPSATRGSRVDRDGPGTRRPRLGQGGRHRRRHGGILFCRRRPAIRSGGAR